MLKIQRSGRRVWEWLTDGPWKVAIIVFLIGLGILGGGFLYLYPVPEEQVRQRTWYQFVTDLYANGGVELLSISVTVLIIDRLNQKRATKERQRALILQMGSPDNAFAIEAARILRSEGWLINGVLRAADLHKTNLVGAYLGKANLSEANLSFANLSRVNLEEANLSRANLGKANLSEANLRLANLSRANFGKANLSWANFGEANLSEANLRLANLSRANFGKANLSWANLRGTSLVGADWRDANLGGAQLLEADLAGAFLGGTQFDEETELPDGEKWTPDTKMARFTDRKHPDFWRSDDPESPAYREE